MKTPSRLPGRIILLLALVPVLLVPLIKWDAEATPPKKPDAPPAVVGVANAVTTELAPVHWAPGSVISRRDAKVASEQEGRVVRVVEVGQKVRAGEPLAVLDDTALALQERQGEADLARIQAQLDMAARQEQRYAQLAAQQNIARAQYEQLRADRDMLAQDRARAQALLAQTRHRRTQMVVRAPFDGVVAERSVQLGEYVDTGAPVARLVDTGAQEVRVRAPVDLAEHLAVGMPVQVSVGRRDTANASNAKYRTHPVSALVPVGDEASRQLELRIAMDTGELPVGTAVDVGMPGARKRSVVAVPRDAVILRREGDYVLRVASNDTAERLPVKTGTEVGGLVEVQGAVKPGDRLIVRGGERIEAGQAVSIQPDLSRATASR
ncbi:efflux RND transporter periplasmic adaptor subunit [Lysobacter auxotrophicus]|uniref:Efflux RND transporter periplasmic adaptor subunit n=1 Tax=Lysobacter auxotrophicus TaxID=2992573 RepID=A0ABM8DFN9_9GAMM|nr:efflux RND transporter periplasmic adaptor subunit [Lysobacter auxotrophicus]BDU17381.1 efflux RND transporter periplasmic adaptor subunit [Lysobacter auxotrophicus]